MFDFFKRKLKVGERVVVVLEEREPYYIMCYGTIERIAKEPERYWYTLKLDDGSLRTVSEEAVQKIKVEKDGKTS